MRQALGLGGRAEREADVDHVGRLRAGVVLVGADRLELVGRAGVGVQLVDVRNGYFALKPSITPP